MLVPFSAMPHEIPIRPVSDLDRTRSRLICGGSFNPIHHGHLICARTVAEQMGFARVCLIPTGQPPHKPANTPLAEAAHRFNMCQLATKGSGLFDVDPIEIHRSEPSYTIDTVRQLKAAGCEQPCWIIGADMLQTLPQWHMANELIREVAFAIIRRPGYVIDWHALPPQYHFLRDRVVTVPQIDISATAIRQRVAAGQSIEYLTPPAVAEYIRTHQLYQP